MHNFVNKMVSIVYAERPSQLGTETADSHEDPPWLRPAPILVVSRDTNNENPQISISSAPPKSNISAPGPSSRITDEEEYVGWRPQQITANQVTRSPPPSPLDLAMYPGARASSTADPAEARRAVAGLKPLRILSSRRPGGPASAGPSRRPSVEAMSPNSNTLSGFMGFFSAAKRASTAVISRPPSTSSRASTQSISVAHVPIPVSPLPPPRTPPLLPKPSLAPELLDQIEPELKAHLEALAVQAAAGSSSSSLRPDSVSHRSQNAPTEEEETVLEIRDLNTGEIITIRDLDAVPLTNGMNPSHTTSPTISTKEQNTGARASDSTLVEPDRIPLPHSPNDL
ncbi:hypothetical protein OPQ81_005735 [Rhizoctonia solani]|nr:hypothetical protein OPQ81_005735 [Rhizoctonia solani]